MSIGKARFINKNWFLIVKISYFSDITDIQ